ncbi:unnamed protein product [Onchocerca flexuosa]|uniref:Alanine racemase n=1 Tax=Onchocerca flexuosa TaxID=387005 RepID=A0A183HWJ2_9BILA|nr:unnamed protein product [Onchocerca flexuosa]
MIQQVSHVASDHGNQIIENDPFGFHGGELVVEMQQQFLKTQVWLF